MAGDFRKLQQLPRILNGDFGHLSFVWSLSEWVEFGERQKGGFPDHAGVSWNTCEHLSTRQVQYQPGLLETLALCKEPKDEGFFDLGASWATEWNPLSTEERDIQLLIRCSCSFSNPNEMH